LIHMPVSVAGATRSFALAALLSAWLVAGGCASDKATITKAAAANNQLAPAIITDPALAAYIQQVGNRIVASAKWYDAKGEGPKTHKGDNAWMFTDRMKFHLVNSKTINAFTTGGEHMYVYTALFQMCQTEDELAAVMSHEFAHVYSRHVQKGTDRQTGMTVFAYGAAGAGYLYGGSQNGAAYADKAKSGAASLAKFAGLSFTRDDEAQADEWGFKFYAHAGWDPDHFGDFFQRMITAGFETKNGYTSDHPTLKSRVEAAKKNAAAWDAAHPGVSTKLTPIADPARFAQIKQQAAAICAAMPDDSQTKQAQQLLASFSSCVAPVDQPEQVEAKKDLAVTASPDAGT
jgi:predicted Zn-dependent protease